MATLAILGASGHGKVIADIALSSEHWSDVVFFDDAYPAFTEIECWSVQGNAQDLVTKAKKFAGVVVAIGDNAIRFEKQKLLVKSGFTLPIIIHPNAIVSPYACIGNGSVVMAGAVINPFATIGEACIINSNTVVEHDCVLANAVHISPSAVLAGGVQVGEFSWLGIGSCVKQLISIGEHVVVGAGSTVINNLESHKTYVGSPARVLIK